MGHVTRKGKLFDQIQAVIDMKIGDAAMTRAEKQHDSGQEWKPNSDTIGHRSERQVKPTARALFVNNGKAGTVVHARLGESDLSSPAKLLQAKEPLGIFR